MKLQLQAMAGITKRYEPTIATLEQMRKQELLIENEISTGRLSGAELERAHLILIANRKKADRLTKKLLPDFTTDD